jgi:hypothetical protein
VVRVERGTAYNEHLASVRHDAYERGIGEDSERQGVLTKRTRNRFNELLTVGHEESMRWFEEVGASGTLATTIISSCTSDPDLRRS